MCLLKGFIGSILIGWLEGILASNPPLRTTLAGAAKAVTVAQQRAAVRTRPPSHSPSTTAFSMLRIYHRRGHQLVVSSPSTTDRHRQRTTVDISVQHAAYLPPAKTSSTPSLYYFCGRRRASLPPISILVYLRRQRTVVNISMLRIYRRRGHRSFRRRR